MEPPSVEFDLSPIQYVEIAKAVKHMKSSASPCPFDHISILVFKNCPILRTYLYRIIKKMLARALNSWSMEKRLYHFNLQKM